MNKTTTATASYTINFWDGRTKEWKGCGAGTFTDINQAKLALRAHSNMCAGIVDFKLVTVSWVTHTQWTKKQLIASATKRYHEQLQREYNYRQAIRDGLVQPFDAKTIEYWDIADNH